MARLIDANKLENDLTNDICGIPLHGNCKTNYANIRATIRAQPAIDAVPVVYCHKCKMFGHIAGKSGHCLDSPPGEIVVLVKMPVTRN